MTSIGNSRWISLPALLGMLASCTVGPNYVRPSAPTPTHYKELQGWQPAQPRLAASGQSWWSIFNDPVLDGLEQQVRVTNQTLKADEAAYRESVAVVQEARAGYFPTVSVGVSGARNGAGRAAGSAAGGGSGFSGGGGGSGGRVENSFSLTPGVSWTPDLWGSIRRLVESDVANAQASAADLAGAQLSLQAQLAIDYFQLRVDDQLIRVLNSAAQGYQRSLKITRNQYNAGVVAQTDVITAETQLEGTQAQAVAQGVQRAQLEHAIAMLIGKPPADLTLAPAMLAKAVPVQPPGLPSTLLERRPDIAAAERAVDAANAQIGVAISAYYPTVTLSASYGFMSPAISSLLSLSNAVWSIGGSASENLFEGGLRGAQVAAARAAYDETVANYRQTVLAAFQQVEDELAALRIYGQQQAIEDRAVRSAEQAVRLTLNQYQAGTIPYTSVVVAEATALTNEETAVTALGNRLTASATLVEAIGGGWRASDLPSAPYVESGAHVLAPAPTPGLLEYLKNSIF